MGSDPTAAPQMRSSSAARHCRNAPVRRGFWKRISKAVSTTSATRGCSIMSLWIGRCCGRVEVRVHGVANAVCNGSWNTSHQELLGQGEGNHPGKQNGEDRQGGVISPTLANLALDGLEALLKQHFGKRNS